MGNAATKTEATPIRSNRMTLANITKGKHEKPLRVLLYGTEGIGKSTWAASAPSPIFLPVEDGTAHLDVARLPQPETWQDVIDAIDTLTVEKHDFKTFAIDTLDAAESMLWAFICERDKQPDVEAYGYGKGYVAALSEWRIFLRRLEQLQKARNMGVILTAHSWIKTFKNPEGADFDRYEMKLNAKASGLLREWSEDVLFAQYETLVLTDKQKRTRGQDGARVLHTQRTAAWDAKNRHSLPDTLPLDFADFAAAMKVEQVQPVEVIRASIEAKLTELADEKLTATVADKVKKAGDDAVQLSKIDNRMSALLLERKKGA
jgi:hypothetical protein